MLIESLILDRDDRVVYVSPNADSSLRRLGIDGELVGERLMDLVPPALGAGSVPDETLAPEPFARKLVEAVRAAGVAQRTTILSFDWRALQAVQKIAPEIGTVYLSIRQRNFDNIGAGRLEGSTWTAGIQHADHGSVPKMIKAAGGRIWSSFHGDLDAAQVKEAKSLGLTVLAWTVNDPARMAQVMDMGVDGIVTDRPDLLREEVRRRGLPLPASTPVTP